MTTHYKSHYTILYLSSASPFGRVYSIHITTFEPAVYLVEHWRRFFTLGLDYVASDTGIYVYYGYSIDTFGDEIHGW